MHPQKIDVQAGGLVRNPEQIANLSNLLMVYVELARDHVFRLRRVRKVTSETPCWHQLEPHGLLQEPSDRRVLNCVRKKLLFHVGMHKTGSSFIQNTLQENFDELRSRGILYVQTGTTRKNPKVGVRHLPLRKSIDAEGERSFALSQAKSEIKSSDCHTAIVSHEGFFAGNISPDTLRLCFEEFETTIAVYLRNPVDYLESKYREWVRLGIFSGDIDQFTARSVSELNYQALIEDWSRCFPRDRLVVKSVDAIRKEDLIGDFLGNIEGFNASEASLIPSAVDNLGSSNAYTLSKLMANKLSLLGTPFPMAILEDQQFDYASNEGRLLSDELLQEIRRIYESDYLRIVNSRMSSVEPPRMKWAMLPQDKEFYSPRVRQSALDHLTSCRLVHESNVAKNASAARRLKSRAKRSRNLAAQVRSLEDSLQQETKQKDELSAKVTKLRRAIVRAKKLAEDAAGREEAALMHIAELKRKLNSVRRQRDQLKWWRRTNWGHYIRHALKGVIRVSDK